MKRCGDGEAADEGVDGAEGHRVLRPRVKASDGADRLHCRKRAAPFKRRCYSGAQHRLQQRRRGDEADELLGQFKVE